MKHAQVITNKKVATTFNSVSCLLRRTLTKLEKANGIRRYTIVTDYCNYVDSQIPITEEVEIIIPEVLDEFGSIISPAVATGTFESTAVLDINGNPTYRTETNLVSFGLAKETKPAYSSEVADVMFEQIRPLIDFTRPYSEIIFKVEQLSLLGGTQQDVPLGTLPEDWEILNAE